MVVTRTTRNRFVLNRARGFESHHLRQKSQIQTDLRLFLLCASAATGGPSGRLAGFQGPFSPKFSPTGTLASRLLNLLEIILSVDTAVECNGLFYFFVSNSSAITPAAGRSAPSRSWGGSACLPDRCRRNPDTQCCSSS